ncbi:hypothetical protein J2785_006445 [Burkholderia ambifaria]|nr:hypothetical protein [Burkholderia ambifaria]
MNRGNHVADGSHRLELFRLDALARHFLKLDGEIDCIDAVEIEFVEQMRIGSHALRFDREVLVKDGADALKDFCVGHVSHPFCRHGFLRRVMRLLTHDERGQRIDRTKMRLRVLVVRRDRQLKFFAKHDPDFQRVDRIQSDSVGREKRHVVTDIVDGHVVEIEHLDQKLLNLQF